MTMSALEQFNVWLPGELRYSVLKAPYHLKLPRTALGQAPTSTYGFIGTEWAHAKLMREMGVHHAEDGQKTGQSQLMKFASAYYDKMGMIDWLKIGTYPTHMDLQIMCADLAASRATRTNPYDLIPTWFDPAEELEKDFEDTLFASGILRFQQGIQETAVTDKKGLDVLRREAHKLGAAATITYLYYAATNLSPEQYFLPPSQLQQTA